MKPQPVTKPTFNKLKSPCKPVNAAPMATTDSFRKYELCTNLFSGFKSYTGESLLSATNTPMKTPLSNDAFHQFSYTEHKQPKIQKNLFMAAAKVPESPPQYDKRDLTAKSLFFSHYNHSVNTTIGQKRASDTLTQTLEL